MKWSEVFLYLVMTVCWVCGIALAKGFWMTTICVLIFPVSWVVLAQHLIGAT